MVEQDLERLVTMKEDYKGTYQRLKFLNKFYLYSELSKHTADQNAWNYNENEEIPRTESDFRNKPLDRYEIEVMKIFNCDSS